jgi:phosphatidylinositol 4-kinase B
MQASLNDFSTRRDSQSFIICQRVLRKCHEIIFGDQLLPSSSPYAGFIHPTCTSTPKIKHHVEPVFVGLGVLLAGSPAMPQLAQLIGPVAIEQGRADEGDELKSWGSDTHNGTYSASSSPSLAEDETDSPSSLEELEDSLPQPHVKASMANSIPQQVGLLIRRRTLGARTLPALPLHLQQDIRNPRLSLDPLDQLNPDENVMPHKSSPSLVLAHTPSRIAATNGADFLLEKYNAQHQVQLLRSHYYSSEVCHIRCPLLNGFDVQQGSILALP